MEEKKLAPKGKKKFLKIGGIIVGALIVILIAVILMLDIIVASAIRNITPQVTGTAVSLKSVSISLLNGSFKLNELKVGNPEGYSYPNAFELDYLNFHLDVSTLFSDTLVIKEITTSGMKVDFEAKLTGASNIGDIKKNADKFLAQFTPESTEEETETTTPVETTEPARSQEIAINSFNADNVSLVFGSNVSIPLPPISITGSQMSLTEFTSKFFTSLFTSIADAAVSIKDSEAVNSIKDAVNQGFSGSKESINSAVDNIKNIFK